MLLLISGCLSLDNYFKPNRGFYFIKMYIHLLKLLQTGNPDSLQEQELSAFLMKLAQYTEAVKSTLKMRDVHCPIK